MVFSRSVGNIPEVLDLENVDISHRRISPSNLCLLIDHCPFLSSLSLNYFPTDEELAGTPTDGMDVQVAPGDNEG